MLFSFHISIHVIISPTQADEAMAIMLRTRTSIVAAIAWSCFLLASGVNADYYTRNSRLSVISCQNSTETHSLTTGKPARGSEVYALANPELLSCGNGTSNCCLEGQQCGANLLCYRGNQVSGSIALIQTGKTAQRSHQVCTMTTDTIKILTRFCRLPTFWSASDPLW